MFILDSLLVSGLRFVLETVATAADAEAHDDTALREQLLEAQMRLEEGEISEEEFARIERDVLAGIREIRGGAPRPISSDDVSTVAVDSWKPDR